MSVRFVVGDVFDALATMPDASVDLVLSSPPFLATTPLALSSTPAPEACCE